MSHVRLREFVTFIGGAVALPFSARVHRTRPESAHQVCIRRE
jgi:hypothetical protein